MNKLSLGESAFGSFRRLDEDYLNSVLQDDVYAELESNHAAETSNTGTAAVQSGHEGSSFVRLELLKPIRHVSFRSLHRLLSFPLTEMISTAPPDLNGTSFEMAAEKSEAKCTASSHNFCLLFQLLFPAHFSSSDDYLF